CTTTSNGALTFNPDGTYDYVPNPNYNGTDSFIYELCDVDGDCDTALVNITILPVNDAAIANAHLNSTNEATHLVVATVVTNHLPRRDRLIPYTKLFRSCTTTSNGALTFNPDGTYDCVPNPNYNGTDSFIYELCDVDGDCDTAIVNITILPVNDAPIANADVNSTNEDTPIVGATVVPNDIPSGDGGNVYNNACVVCTTTTNGALTFNSDGTYDYVPDTDYNGTDSFIYELCDVDGDCDTALVIIVILSDNDPPVAVADRDTTDVDMAVLIC